METKAINTKLKGHARVDAADVLRGLAVMGIIILHSIEHFNFYSFPDTAGQSAWLNFSDRFQTKRNLLYPYKQQIRYCRPIRFAY